MYIRYISNIHISYSSPERGFSNGGEGTNDGTDQYSWWLPDEIMYIIIFYLFYIYIYIGGDIFLFTSKQIVRCELYYYFLVLTGGEGTGDGIDQYSRWLPIETCIGYIVVWYILTPRSWRGARALATELTNIRGDYPKGEYAYNIITSFIFYIFFCLFEYYFGGGW